MKIFDTIKAYFKDEKIQIEGKRISGFVRISRDDLFTMARGGTGQGIINIDVIDENKSQPGSN